MVGVSIPCETDAPAPSGQGWNGAPILQGRTERACELATRTCNPSRRIGERPPNNEGRFGRAGASNGRVREAKETKVSGKCVRRVGCRLRREQALSSVSETSSSVQFNEPIPDGLLSESEGRMSTSPSIRARATAACGSPASSLLKMFFTCHLMVCSWQGAELW